MFFVRLRYVTRHNKRMKVFKNENRSYYLYKHWKDTLLRSINEKKKLNSWYSFSSAGNSGNIGIMLTWWKNAQNFYVCSKTTHEYLVQCSSGIFIFREAEGGEKVENDWNSLFAWFLCRGSSKMDHSLNKNSSLSHSWHQIKIFPTWLTCNFCYHKISPAK